MNKKDELASVKANVDEYTLRIESINNHIGNLEREVALLENLKSQFTQNIEVLKSDGIITAASEYKKVRSDLSTVTKRLYAMTIDLSNFREALRKAKIILLDLESKYDMLLSNQDAKVILGKFGNDRQK